MKTPTQIAAEAADQLRPCCRADDVYWKLTLRTEVSRVILTAIQQATEEGAKENANLRGVIAAWKPALELAAKADTSQTCSPGNEGIAVAAMDALKITPDNLTDQLAARDGCIARWQQLVTKAQSILTDNIVPDGISNSECINQLLGLLDGPEYRAAYLARLATERKEDVS